MIRPSRWLLTGAAATLLTLAVAAPASAAVANGRSQPAQAPAAAAPDMGIMAAGCSTVAINPRAESGYSVVASNSASCTGPVKNVKASVKLHQYKAGWYVAASKSTSWGTVSNSRYGYVDAWIHPVPAVVCYSYITESTVTWTYSNGSPGQATRYSSTVKLKPSGPC
ncbi:MAG TPA: hypothetical protein VGP31_08075 [Planosporangium sp.]|jgi:hypothetical protein|nr:hypothetical protein [Planosporangium sp.]